MTYASYNARVLLGALPLAAPTLGAATARFRRIVAHARDFRYRDLDLSVAVLRAWIAAMRSGSWKLWRIADRVAQRGAGSDVTGYLELYRLHSAVLFQDYAVAEASRMILREHSAFLLSGFYYVEYDFLSAMSVAGACAATAGWRGSRRGLRAMGG